MGIQLVILISHSQDSSATADKPARHSSAFLPLRMTR